MARGLDGCISFERPQFSLPKNGENDSTPSVLYKLRSTDPGVTAFQKLRGVTPCAGLCFNL